MERGGAQGEERQRDERRGGAAPGAWCGNASTAGVVSGEMMQPRAFTLVLVSALGTSLARSGLCNDKRIDCANWARDGECSGENAVRCIRNGWRHKCVTAHPSRVSALGRNTWPRCARFRAARARTYATTRICPVAHGLSKGNAKQTLMPCYGSAQHPAVCALRNVTT